MINRLIIVILLWGCSTSQKESHEEINKVAWLAGTWIEESESGNFIETWSITDTNQLSGSGTLILGGDTVFLERLSIFVGDSGLFYSASVEGQNQDLPLLFENVVNSDRLLHFRNSGNEFPHEVIYQPVEVNKMILNLIGTTNTGEEIRSTYSFKRINN